MRLAIVIEHALTRPWNDTGPWAAALASGFAGRGWSVRVLADTALDRRPFAGAGIELMLRSPSGTFVKARPLSYRSWVDRNTGTHGGVTLSLTRIWAGDVWIPLGLSAREQWDRVRSGHSPIHGVRAALHTPRLVQTALAERRAARDAARGGVRPLGLGGPGALPDGVMTATRLDRAEPSRIAHDRAAVRRALGLGAGPVGLASAAHLGQPGWAEMLGGLAAGPVEIRLVVCGGSPHAVAMLARRWGVGDRVMAISGVDPVRMGALIAASDAVVLPAHHPDRRGSGRLAADALRVGRPVLASAGAPGFGLIEPRGFGTPPVGLVVGVVGWAAQAGALASGLGAAPAALLAVGGVARDPDTGRLRGMAEAARSVGAGLGFDGLVARLADRLERRVDRAGARSEC